MLGLPLDVWATMLFCILAFFGASIWVLVYTLRQEETKLALFQTASKTVLLSSSGNLLLVFIYGRTSYIKKLRNYGN